MDFFVNPSLLTAFLISDLSFFLEDLVQVALLRHLNFFCSPPENDLHPACWFF